jgi:hypothetical protein
MFDAHVSGKWSAAPPRWRTAAREVSAVADVVTFTESTKHRRDLVVKGRAAHHGGECSILWDRERRAGADGGTVTLSERSWRLGPAHTRTGVEAAWKVLESQTEVHRLLRIVAHLPSGVQYGRRFTKDSDNVTAWVDALSGLRRETEHLRREHKPDDVTISADFNVDLSLTEWRRLIRGFFAGTGLHFAISPTPTHGKRVIDGHLTTLRGSAKTLGKVNGFDHRPVLADLT